MNNYKILITNYNKNFISSFLISSSLHIVPSFFCLPVYILKLIVSFLNTKYYIKVSTILLISSLNNFP